MTCFPSENDTTEVVTKSGGKGVLAKVKMCFPSAYDATEVVTRSGGKGRPHHPELKLLILLSLFCISV